MVNSILSMDPLTFVTLILAVATIALALITYKSVNEGKRQVDILLRQTILLRSQYDPILSIKSFSFNNNKLNITIENNGNGPASSLAIETMFSPAKRTYFRDSESIKLLSETEIKEALLKNKQVTIRYEAVDKKLIEKGEKVTPIKLAYILPNKQYNTLVLLTRETCSYTIDLGFGLRNIKGIIYPLYNNLVQLLKENNVTCFVLGFRLLCKNMAEDLIQEQSIATFVVDLTRHSNIEEAYKENTTPPMTIDLMELALKGIPVECDFYLHSKSQINFPSSFEKGEL